MRRPFGSFVLILLASVATVGGEVSSDWPQWRGPHADGVSKEVGWLSTFPETGPRKLWEVKIGRGHSGVVLAKGRLYTLSADADSNQAETIWCLDAGTGKELWKHRYPLESVQRGTNPAGGTPTLVGDLVYSYGAGMNLVCLDAVSGKVVWARDLMKELPGVPTSYGYQNSPVVYADLVVVPALLGRGAGRRAVEPRGGPYPPEGGCLLAFDRKTGKEVWRNTTGASPWSTPVLALFEGQPTLVHLTGKLVVGVNPKDGSTLWTYDPITAGLRPLDVAAAPVIHGNQVVAPVHDGPGARAPAGYSTICLKIQDRKATLLWKSADWCHWFHSGAIWDGHLYGFDEKSNFHCVDLAKGSSLWKTRDLGSTGSSGGGFLIADGKALAVDARGQLTVTELAAGGHKVLARAAVLGTQSGYQCETAPVLLDGRLYCRNHTQLVCYDLKGK